MVTEVSKIEIKFTPQQRKQIYLATGSNHRPSIELGRLGLAALTLAAMAARSDALPISTSALTIKRLLAHQKGSDDAGLFILKIELTTQQQQQIRDLTGKTITSLMLAPDELKGFSMENWEDSPSLLRIGRSIVIALDRTYQSTPLDKVITLPREVGAAKGVFGTGEHIATQLALVIMEERLKGGERVLDLGTGSGVLAVAAARLGANHVSAIDIDPAAVAMARTIVIENEVSDVVTVSLRSIESTDREYDFAVINNVPGVIISLAAQLADVVRPSGLLLASGIIAPRTEDVVRAIRDVGFEVEEQRKQQEWRAVLFRRA